MFSKYAKMFSIGLQNNFIYRWNILFRTLFGLIPLVGTVFIWRAIFDGTDGELAGYNYGQMIWYFVLVMLVNKMVSPLEDDWQIAADIREGQISAFMVKPLNYLGYRVALFISGRLIYVGITVVPALALLWIFRDFVALPQGGGTWALATVSIMMAAAISFLIAYSVALVAFWLLEISTLVFIVYSFEFFLSGQTFPIDIMPGWFREFLMFLPFPYQMFFPVQVFMERVQGPELWRGLGMQAMWVVLLWGLAQVMWKRGLRKYQAVGG